MYFFDTEKNCAVRDEFVNNWFSMPWLSTYLKVSEVIEYESD